MSETIHHQIVVVDRYRKTLEEVIKRKQIICHFREELIEIFGDRREAVFRNLDSGETTTRSYGMLKGWM